VTFGVRPEHIAIRNDGGAPLGTVRVDLVEQLGGQTMLYATTPDNQPLTIAIDGQQAIAPGATVSAYADPARYHVFGANGLAL
jgi:multiple sugar transport system ATP-binding protein